MGATCAVKMRLRSARGFFKNARRSSQVSETRSASSIGGFVVWLEAGDLGSVIPSCWSSSCTKDL